jgi:adenylate cyclase
VDAVRCAIELQRGMAERNAEVPQEKRIEFRVGIHQGDIVVEDQDIFGDGVNVAARLESLAEPGGICVSGRVQEDARGKLDIAFEDAGDQQLKNIERPVRIYRMRPKAAAASSRPALPLPGKPSIAVLPFQNMSGDPEQDYFADGMVEEIITALSRFRQLFVIARNSTFTYKGQAADVKQVSRELGVRYVLEGSVRKGGNRVRVTAQLIDATSSAHVWAERYDRNVSDVFAVQDEITASVAGVIEPTLADVEQQRVLRKPPERLDAWEATNEDFGTSTNSDLRKTRQHRPFFAGASSSIRILPLATMDWPSPFSGTSGIIQRVLSRKFKEPLSQKRTLPFRLTTRTRWRTRY